MTATITNISEVVKGISDAAIHLKNTCGGFKYKPGDLYDIITNVAYANIDLEVKNFIGDSEILNDPLSLHLLLYWCWWAYIAYSDLSYIDMMIPDKNHYHYFNYGLNSLGQPFFFITVDHYSRSIIISIRGTYSLADVVTDASGTLIPFTSDIEILAHTGFVVGANNVLDNIKDILPKFIAEFPSYPIKITGHSYGAAIASMVCTMLEMERQLGKINSPFPVRSFNFCCPPVYNYHGTIKVCQVENQISTVCGWDIVPRSSLNNVQLFLCDKEPDFDTKSFVPGTILWITYTEETEEINNIYAIEPSNPVLTNMYMHPNMGNDHLLSRTYGFLLAYIVNLSKEM